VYSAAEHLLAGKAGSGKDKCRYGSVEGIEHGNVRNY
jgi:hypothetical protein